MSPKPVGNQAFRTIHVVRRNVEDAEEVDVLLAERLPVVPLSGFEVLSLAELAVVAIDLDRGIGDTGVVGIR